MTIEIPDIKFGHECCKRSRQMVSQAFMCAYNICPDCHKRFKHYLEDGK